MGQKILTDAQEKIINAVSSEPNLADFYLSGGTALAARYLEHRFSEDLDFFVFMEPDKIFLHSFTENLKNAIGADKLRYERLYDRNQFFYAINNEELKIEFTKYPFKQLSEVELWKGIKVDSLRDIAANKLMAMLDRFDPKDFVDLYFLFKEFDFREIKKDAEKKFEIQIDNIFLGGELAKSRRIEALPKMTKPLTIEELKEFFSEKTKELDYEIFSD